MPMNAALLLFASSFSDECSRGSPFGWKWLKLYGCKEVDPGLHLHGVVSSRWAYQCYSVGTHGWYSVDQFCSVARYPASLFTRSFLSSLKNYMKRITRTQFKQALRTTSTSSSRKLKRMSGWIAPARPVRTTYE